MWEGVHGDVSISFGRGECSARGCRWWGCRVFFHEVWECEWRGGVLRYCRNVRPTWVKFDSKDTKESGVVFEVLSTKSKKRT